MVFIEVGMKTFTMSESLYDAIYRTVEDYMHVIEHLESEYGLISTSDAKY